MCTLRYDILKNGVIARRPAEYTRLQMEYRGPFLGGIAVEAYGGQT
jgi:hypothetical protein